VTFLDLEVDLDKMTRHRHILHKCQTFCIHVRRSSWQNSAMEKNKSQHKIKLRQFLRLINILRSMINDQQIFIILHGKTIGRSCWAPIVVEARIEPSTFRSVSPTLYQLSFPARPQKSINRNVLGFCILTFQAQAQFSMINRSLLPHWRNYKSLMLSSFWTC
jgi:hypothetical protein